MIDAHRVSLCRQVATLFPQNICPRGNPRPPLTFISACATGRMPEVRNVCVEPSRRGGRSCVRADVLLPVELCFADSTGARFTAQDMILVPIEAALRVPDCEPYTVEAMGRLTIINGEGGAGASIRVVFNADVCLYVATMHRGDRCHSPCPPHCTCDRCLCQRYFRLPLFPS